MSVLIEPVSGFIQGLGFRGQVTLALFSAFAAWYLFRAIRLGRTLGGLIGGLVGSVLGYAAAFAAALSIALLAGWIQLDPSLMIQDITSAAGTIADFGSGIVDDLLETVREGVSSG